VDPVGRMMIRMFLGLPDSDPSLFCTEPYLIQLAGKERNETQGGRKRKVEENVKGSKNDNETKTQGGKGQVRHRVSKRRGVKYVFGMGQKRQEKDVFSLRAKKG
jgi:hypothetical protein